MDFAVPMGARRLALVEAKTTRTVLPRMGDPMRFFMRAAKGYQCQGWIVHPGPDLPGFSGAGEGVHACSADSIATKVLGFHAAPWTGQSQGGPGRRGHRARSRVVEPRSRDSRRSCRVGVQG